MNISGRGINEKFKSLEFNFWENNLGTNIQKLKFMGE